jgi:hypothetical protein
MEASRRGLAWCRICRPPEPRSRSTIPPFWPADCGWRSRATRGRVEIAKWSGVAASRSASNSPANVSALEELPRPAPVKGVGVRVDQRRGQIAARYHRSRRDELRVAVVGQPRHELDPAPDGGGDHARGHHWCSAVRAVGFLAVKTSAARRIAQIPAGRRVARTSAPDSAAPAYGRLRPRTSAAHRRRAQYRRW